MNGTVLVTNTYDGYTAGPCSPVAGLTGRTGLALHDDTNFGLGFAYRGNLTRSVSVGGVQCLGYETTGVVTGTMDGAGRYVTAAPSSSTNYSLPGVLTPGGNANLQTSITYAELVGGDEFDGTERGQRDDDIRLPGAAAIDQDPGRGGDGLHVRGVSGDGRGGGAADGDAGDGHGGAMEADVAGRIRAGGAVWRAGTERPPMWRCRRWTRSTVPARARRWGN